MATSQQKTRARGQIIPKGPDKYLVRVHLGGRKYVGQVINGKKKDAEQFLTLKLRERDTRTGAIPPSKMTLDEFFDQWLKVKEAEIAVRTHNIYKYLLKSHVRPRIGALRLDRVTPLVLQDFVNGMVSDGIGGRTIQYSCMIVVQAFKYAVQMRLLPESPALYLKRPKVQHTEQEILTTEQVQTLWDANKSSPWYPLWVVLLTTGMRPQEALALQWSDITRDTNEVTKETFGFIQISRALVQMNEGRYEVGPTKTHRSKRPITVPAQVLETLDEHRKRQARITPWVFCNRAGNPWNIGKVRRAWYAALATAKLPKLRLYTTRHSHLSHLVARTGSLRAAQERAGHANMGITAKFYTHHVREADLKTVQMVDKLYFGT